MLILTLTLTLMLTTSDQVAGVPRRLHSSSSTASKSIFFTTTVGEGGEHVQDCLGIECRRFYLVLNVVY